MSRGPHVRDLFIGHGANGYEVEGVSKSKAKGKDKGQLGGYKPKILSGDSLSNIPLTEAEHDDPPKEEGRINRAFIIGDKDVPMKLEPAENIYSEIGENIAHAVENDDQLTNNPIFKDSTPPVEVPKVSKPEVIDGVVIPAPDYEEEEVTVDFDESDVDFRRHSLYTEFIGEDFSRYLQDDDEEVYVYDRPRYTISTSSPVSRKIKKSKTEVLRGGKPKKDSTKHLFRQNSKTTGRNTLRNFSVSDTKLAISYDGKENQGDAPTRSSSYEAFLHARNGTPFLLDSSSNDSGHETGDDVRKSEGNFWKKLTLKFKKTGYSLKQ